MKTFKSNEWMSDILFIYSIALCIVLVWRAVLLIRVLKYSWFDPLSDGWFDFLNKLMLETYIADNTFDTNYTREVNIFRVLTVIYWVLLALPLAAGLIGLF